MLGYPLSSAPLSSTFGAAAAGPSSVPLSATVAGQASASATVVRSATIVGDRYVVGIPRRWDRGLVKLPAKAPGERFWIEFNFAENLGVSESIVSAQIGLAVHSGIDLQPELLLSGGLIVAGGRIQQMLQGGLDGVVYRLACTATTSADQILVRSCSLRVSSPLLH